jgi:SAM-dependent methyltransferase
MAADLFLRLLAFLLITDLLKTILGGRPVKSKTLMDQYAENQRLQYDATSVSIEDAKSQVAPDYEVHRQTAPNHVRLMLREYSIRSGRDNTDVSSLKFLDFGCGVGRVMEALLEMGCSSVDGADISESMLSHCRVSPLLRNSNFYLTNGRNLGGAPLETYDIVYSFLCLHHIPMRQTRISIIEHMYACLKPGGMCFLEFKLFPGVTKDRIPANHARWTENRPAKYTNSASDVWITPDELGLVYQDLSMFFRDVFMLEAETGWNHFEMDPAAIYQYAFNQFFVGGFTAPKLSKILHMAPNASA